MKATPELELQSATDSFSARKRELQRAGERFGKAHDRLEAAKLAMGVQPAPKPELRPEPEPFELPAAEVEAIEAMTALELCHEWRLVKAKVNFDLASLPAERDEENNDRSERLLTEANERIAVIEAAIGERELTTPLELYEVLRIVLANEAEFNPGDDSLEAAMLAAIRQRLQRMAYPPIGTAARTEDATAPVKNLNSLAEVERVRLADRLDTVIGKLGAVEFAVRGLVADSLDHDSGVGGIYENIGDLRAELTDISVALIMRRDGEREAA
jgi:hypothetical protein